MPDTVKKWSQIDKILSKKIFIGSVLGIFIVILVLMACSLYLSAETEKAVTMYHAFFLIFM